MGQEVEVVKLMMVLKEWADPVLQIVKAVPVVGALLLQVMTVMESFD